MKIENLKEGRYNIKGDFTFENGEGEELKMNVVDALEIAYTLFDWAGMSYAPLDEINDKVEG